LISNKPILIAILPCIFFLFICPANGSTKEKCIDVVQKNLYEDVIDACMADFHTQSGRIDYIFGKSTHFLGSNESPSNAARIIHQKALSGDGMFQFFWGLINITVYKHELRTAMNIEENNALAIRLSEEGMNWIFKAADQGYAEPMLFLLRYAVNSSSAVISDDNFDKLFIYANALVNANEPGAEVLLRKLRTTSSIEKQLDEFEKKLENYRNLPEEEILRLVKAVQFGFYTSSENVITQFNVEKNQKKQEKLLRHLVNLNKVYMGQAAYELSKLQAQKNTGWGRKDSKILRGISIDEKYPLALRDEGVRLACSDKLDAALVMLKEAKKRGDVESADYIDELKEYGNIYDCPSE
jgi:hypothetical protein